MAVATFEDLKTDYQRLLMPGIIRLSEVISALSTALDITSGQPEGHASRSCIVGLKIARQFGVPEAELGPLFYALLLKDLGCSSNAAKMAWLFGTDDRTVKKDFKSIDWTKATKNFQFATKHAAVGKSPLEKAMQIIVLARHGESTANKMVETRCHRGADIARQLGFPEQTAEAITYLDELWNGKGQPYRRKGEEIPLFSRILCLAQTVEVFHATQGKAAALAVALERKGHWFDPQLVDALFACGEDLWDDLKDPDFAKQVSNCEPPDEIRYVDEEELDTITAAFASVVDAKSPWTHKHSERVAEIAKGISWIMGYSAEQQRDIHRAGLLHDLGKLGVSNMILDKPGRPTDEEYRQIRMHPDFSGQIMNRVAAFRLLSEVASAHHERLDGNGYHRQLPGHSMSVEARILAIADVFEALTAARPYRDGLSIEQVESIMQRDLGTAFCPEVYSALQLWLDRTTITSRVEAQLEAIEKLHNSM